MPPIRPTISVRSAKHLKTLLVLLGVAATACGPADDAQIESGEPVARVEQPTAFVGFWTAVTTTAQAIELMYKARNWFNCDQGGTCPESEAHREATRIILELEDHISMYDTDDKITDFRVLLDRAALDYAHPELMSQMEEQTLVNEARDLLFHFRDRLDATDPTNQAEVNSAYVLAPFFNLLAALTDNIAHTALANGRVPMDLGWINARRAETLATNYRLVGAQSLWYQCPGGQTQVSTVESVNNEFQTKKLWKRFADYSVNVQRCDDTYTCNPFARVTMPNESGCPRTACGGFLGFCSACVTPSLAQTIYAEELPKIVERMNRDENVRVVRAAIETLVKQSAERGTGLLWHQPSGELDLWETWSSRSRKPTALSSADPGFWSPVGAGDYDGDGDGDILWSGIDGSLSYWELTNGEVTEFTPGTNDFRMGSIPYFGDLDGDRVSDIVWTGAFGFILEDGTTVYDYVSDIWTMNARSTVPREITSNSSTVEQIQGMGNFGGDGRADILYREPASGNVSVAVSGGGRIGLSGASTDWALKGVGDFNADGWSDILWYNTDHGWLSVWVVQDGTVIDFAGTGPTVHPSWGWTIQGVADVDHDGVSDIIWRHTNGTVSYWMMSNQSSVREYTSMANPGGTFVGSVALGPPLPANPSAPPISESFCGASTGKLQNPGFTDLEWWGGSFANGLWATFAGDVSGDKRVDLVAVGNGTVNVSRSTGTGFSGIENWSSEYVFGARGTLLGDVNGDEKADLVVLNDNSVQVRISTGWSFNNAAQWSNAGFYGSRGTYVGDVDGDNRADLVAVGDNYVGVIRSTGGGFGSYQQWRNSTFHGGFGTFLADVTGDGRADLVTIGAGTIDVSRSTGSSFGGTENWFSGSIPSGGYAILLGDVSGDGRADLVLRNANLVQVWRSTGTSFGDPEIWWSNLFHGNRANFVGDVNGDGRADLLASTDSSVGIIRSQ